MKRSFKIGELVRLRKTVKSARRERPPHNAARIERFYEDIIGGVRLDAPLSGFYSWNVKDLARAK